jgi:hypothetical protein
MTNCSTNQVAVTLLLAICGYGGFLEYLTVSQHVEGTHTLDNLDPKHISETAQITGDTSHLVPVRSTPEAQRALKPSPMPTEPEELADFLGFNPHTTLVKPGISSAAQVNSSVDESASFLGRSLTTSLRAESAYDGGFTDRAGADSFGYDNEQASGLRSMFVGTNWMGTSADQYGFSEQKTLKSKVTSSANHQVSEQELADYEGYN